MWGYIDRHGNYVVPPHNGHGDSFKEGLASVQITAGSSDFRYIDPHGNFVTPHGSDRASIGAVPWRTQPISPHRSPMTRSLTYGTVLLIASLQVRPGHA
ncbi:MAG TPA: WG repeat-containing protein [Longimicrobium sp.]|jgi:hypothetical protein